MAPHLLLVSSLAFGNAETSKQSPTTITTKNWVLMDDECQRGMSDIFEEESELSRN
jgi:hypothetical protein